MFSIVTRDVQSEESALFVGAGLSKAAGFVDWKELMREIAIELQLDIEKESDLIALAQYHINERGGRDRISRLLLEEFTKDATLTENHRLIATLPIDTIWTTNYDDLLETAFKEAGRRADVKTTAANLAQSLPNHDVVIYKMHGDIRQPHEAVLTKEDYETYDEKRGAFSTTLKGDLIRKTFLFVGFSFTDPNIDYILSRIRSLLGQNQRSHYCLMKWPDRPKGENGGEQADYEYRRRKLELRISDLSRYRIHAVMVDNWDEITEILRELNRRAHIRHIFVSGSAHDFGPLGKERLERLCRRLGREVIARGFNLVSGFGRGIGGAVTLGALDEVYSKDLSLRRVLLFPFPQTDCVEKDKLYEQYRTSMLANSGFAFFVCGNREDPKTGKAVLAQGVLGEFEIACKLGKTPIPLGASGWAAREIWKRVTADLKIYFGDKDVAPELAMLGDEHGSDDDYVGAFFGVVDKLSRSDPK